MTDSGKPLVCQLRTIQYGKRRCYTLREVNDVPAAPTPACKHKRTQLIAKDSDAQYVECLDCGEVLEAGELEKLEKRDTSGFDESLSDA
jgi:hypothetical protein